METINVVINDNLKELVMILMTCLKQQKKSHLNRMNTVRKEVLCTTLNSPKKKNLPQG